MKQNKKGLSLIELLITLSLLGVILTICYTVYLTGILSFIRASENLDKQSNVRIAASFIEASLRKTTIDKIKINHNQLIVDKETYEFDKKSGILYLKRGAVRNQLAMGIDEFNPMIENNTVFVLIASTSDTGGKTFRLAFNIYIRENMAL